MSEYYSDLSTRKSKLEPVEVEVYLKEKTRDGYLIQLEEDTPVFEIPRYGIKLLRQVGDYVTLRLSERKAINYNLI